MDLDPLDPKSEVENAICPVSPGFDPDETWDTITPTLNHPEPEC